MRAALPGAARHPPRRARRPWFAPRRPRPPERRTPRRSVRSRQARSARPRFINASWIGQNVSGRCGRVFGELGCLLGAVAGDRKMAEDVAHAVAEAIPELGDHLMRGMAKGTGIAAVFDQRQFGPGRAEDMVPPVADRQAAVGSAYRLPSGLRASFRGCLRRIAGSARAAAWSGRKGRRRPRRRSTSPSLRADRSLR